MLQHVYITIIGVYSYINFETIIVLKLQVEVTIANTSLCKSICCLNNRPSIRMSTIRVWCSYRFRLSLMESLSL